MLKAKDHHLLNNNRIQHTVTAQLIPVMQSSTSHLLTGSHFARVLARVLPVRGFERGHVPIRIVCCKVGRSEREGMRCKQKE